MKRKTVANLGHAANQTSFPGIFAKLQSSFVNTDYYHNELPLPQQKAESIFAKLQSSFVNTDYYHNELPLPQQKAEIITRIND
ncbi:hypothetical protein P8452_08589 [Trifolium repens]|nr:hypothetical protein P8452_08589 [Trifolium repens]